MNNFPQVNPLNPGINYLRGNLPFAFLWIMHTYTHTSTCIEQDLKETVTLGLITWSEIGKLNIQAKGPTIWLLRKDMGVFRKNNPTDWFRGEKILQGNTSRKKTPTLEKISSMAYNARKISYNFVCQEKKSITRGLEKKVLTKIKSIIPLHRKKGKWSAFSNWKPLFAPVQIVLFSVTIFMF